MKYLIKYRQPGNYFENALMKFLIKRFSKKELRQLNQKLSDKKKELSLKDLLE